MTETINPTETDLVRRYTSEELLNKIEQDIERHIQFYAAQPDHVIQERIEALRREWSMERWLQLNVAGVGLLTGLMAFVGKKRWGLLTGAALGMFLYHATCGYHPMIPVLRRMGVRTRREIDRELYALKALLGHLTRVPPEKLRTEGLPAKQVLDAINA
jgi:hypothetical protein